MRLTNTTTKGGSFDPITIDAVWSKGTVVAGNDPAVLRKDACGAWIRYSEYGQLTDNGWEVDHIVPVAAGGSDVLDNLQPLQWRNNRTKSDQFPTWACAVTAVMAT